jgi:hypothetical protein
MTHVCHPGFITKLSVVVAAFHVLCAAGYGQNQNPEIALQFERRLHQTPRGHFGLSPELIARPNETGQSVLPGTKPTFQLLLNKKFIETLGLDKERQSELTKLSIELTDQWKKAIKERVARDGVPHTTAREIALRKLTEFEDYIERNLGKTQIEYLDHLLKRNDVLRKGVRAFLADSNMFLPELKKPDRDRLLQEVENIIAYQGAKGNSIVFEFIENDLSGFLTIDEQTKMRLPAFPLAMAHNLLENSEDVSKICKVVLKDHELDDITGDWSFLIWSYSINPDGSIDRSRTNNPTPLPMSEFAFLEVPLDLTMEQSMALLDLKIGDQYSSVPSEMRRNEYFKAKFELDRKKNQRVTEVLLPFQLQPLRARVKLHAFFIFGPRFILEGWNSKQEKPLSKSEIDETLDKLKEKISDHCRETETEIERVIKRFLDTNGFANNSYPFHDKKWSIDVPPSPINFELLLYGVQPKAVSPRR